MDRRRGHRADHGAATAELLIATVLLLLLLGLIVQGALYWHARQIAAAAANRGLDAARADGGTEAAGRDAARDTLDQIGGGTLDDPQITADRTTTAATVTVTGDVQRLLVPLRVSVTVTGPAERFVPDTP